jgi:hypothetical protein
MVPIDIPPELLTKSIPELLQYLSATKASKDVVIWVRSRIKTLWDKKQYGFTTDPETAKELQKITKSDAYKRMKECIGKVPYLNVVRLGLRIEDLSYTARSDEIHKIRNDVFKRYGPDGINILNIGNTGTLIPLIQHLSDVKIKNNLSQDDMNYRFMELIHGWESLTIFHQTDDGEDKLIAMINRHMNARSEIFFIFGIGTAGKQAAIAIASLNNSGEMHDKGYMFNLLSNVVDQQGRMHYGWMFKQNDPFAVKRIML